MQQITRRFNELEIRDSLLADLKIELGYKQTELNQRIKSQMMQPLSCLENEVRLAERIKLHRIPSNLDLISDGNMQQYLQRDDTRVWLASVPAELRPRAELLLKQEYAVVRDRTKIGIVEEQLISDLAQLDQEKADLLQQKARFS